ncbi:hypothetical protein [Pontibacter indicus]|uniref:DUF3575 domain-containing protein n=1 Tax=Pontibacter indicus TaxID=1317125 RepID=A0A1R3WR84_9BACT|nr:hypothetical protein [Pontibacter indicus]SIT79768.1 hypothetical protein SAMN05444128_0785 [Pontibacter indicus]
MKIRAFSFLLLNFLLMNSKAYSQPTEEMVRFHIAPLNFLDPISGVLQVGVQKNLSQRFALSMDHGFKLQTFRKIMSEGESERKNYKYSKTKAELKYFMSDAASEVRSYIAVEGMYFPQEYEKEHDYLIKNGTSYRYESSQIDRTVWTTSLKYGVEVKVNNFVIDPFLGLGVRRLSIEHQPVGLLEDELYAPTDLWFPPIDRKEGVFYRPHVAMGVKVGYVIK